MTGTPKILTSIHGKRLGLGQNNEIIVNGTRVSQGSPAALLSLLLIQTPKCLCTATTALTL